MEKSLTKEEFMILKILIAKGIEDNDATISLLTEVVQISSEEEKLIWHEKCIAKSKNLN
jgi:hypothetical protein